MDKEKAYFVLVSEKPSVHGKPGAIVEQTLKLAASGLASLVTRTARQRKTGRSYHEAKLANIGEEKAELLLSLTDRVKQKKEGIAGTGSYRLIRYEEAAGAAVVVGQQTGVYVDFPGTGKVDLTEMYQRVLPFDDIWAFGRCQQLPKRNGKKRMHQFAAKWVKLLLQREKDPEKFWLQFDKLGDACSKLGFRMDSGTGFVKRYLECAAMRSEAFAKVLPTVIDIELLGSAIYSLWRYKTHWESFDGSVSWSENSQQCFLLLFQRLEELTK